MAWSSLRNSSYNLVVPALSSSEDSETTKLNLYNLQKHSPLPEHNAATLPIQRYPKLPHTNTALNPPR